MVFSDVVVGYNDDGDCGHIHLDGGCLCSCCYYYCSLAGSCRHEGVLRHKIYRLGPSGYVRLLRQADLTLVSGTLHREEALICGHVQIVAFRSRH